MSELPFPTESSIETPMPGVTIIRDFWSNDEQVQVVEAVREVTQQAPFFVNTTRSGTPYRYKQSNCGELGWIADRNGTRYDAFHPTKNNKWPCIPEIVLDGVKRACDIIGYQGFVPQTCLINYYGSDGRLGMHQDKDEKNLVAPIIGFSLGDKAVMRLNHVNSPFGGKTVTINSGDCTVFHGAGRMIFHGITKIISTGHNLFAEGKSGRINLTIRQVN